MKRADPTPLALTDLIRRAVVLATPWARDSARRTKHLRRPHKYFRVSAETPHLQSIEKTFTGGFALCVDAMSFSERLRRINPWIAA